MKRIIKILLPVSALYLLLMPVYYAYTAYSGTCRHKITTADSSDYHFVTKRDIQYTITVNGAGISETSQEIPVAEIESSMNEKYRN
jgi:hypothetical protein